MKKLAFFLFALSCAAQLNTVLPPQKTVNSTIPSGVLTKLAAATSGGTCHAIDSTVACVGHAGTPALSGQLVFNTGGGTPTALYQALLNKVAAGTCVNDCVLVFDKSSAGGIYEFPSGHAPAPFDIGGGCGGSRTGFDLGCNGRWWPTIQALVNVGNPQYIDIISTGYGDMPPQGTRIIPRNGDGYSSPLNQVANVPLNDASEATFTTANGQPPEFFGDGPMNYRQIGINVQSDSTTGGTPACSPPQCTTTYGEASLGFTGQLIYIQGAGFSGTRYIHVTNAGKTASKDAVLHIGFDQPFIDHCHLGASTGPPCEAIGSLLAPNVNVDLYFDAQNTHFVAGQSYIRFTFAGRPQTAFDVALPVMASGSGTGQCPAGATTGGDVMGNLCVIDSTHAKVTITPSAANSPYFTPPITQATCQASTPLCYNGGSHSYFIDTIPATAPSVFYPSVTEVPDITWVGGGPWAAGTEHAPTNDAINFAYDSSKTPQATITGCTPNCVQSPVDGVWMWPNDTAVHTITAQGVVGKTNWVATPNPHAMTLGESAPVTESGATINATTQTATLGIKSKQPFILDRTATIWVAKTVTAKYDTPPQEIDQIYKAVGQLSSTSGTPYGVDFCSFPIGNGSSGVQYARQVTNNALHGQEYTMRCFFIGMNLTGLACSSGPCPNSYTSSGLDFGADIAVDSVTVVNSTTLDITLFPCDGTTVHPGCTPEQATSQGATGVQIMRNHVHGSDGQILHTGANGDPGPAGSVCNGCNPTNAKAGSGGWICYQTNGQEVNTAIVAAGPYTSIEDSYIDQIWALDKFLYPDTQGIIVDVTTGPGKIINNFLSGATEDQFSGGVGTSYTTAIFADPDDYQVFNNYIYKPPYYHNYGISSNPAISAGGCSKGLSGWLQCTMSIKDNREQKSGARWEWKGNIMDGQWLGVIVSYSSLVQTPRIAENQGTPGTYLGDIFYHDEVSLNEWKGIGLSTNDSFCQYVPRGDTSCGMGVFPPSISFRSYMVNELFLANQNESTFSSGNTPPAQLAMESEDENMTVNHITIAFQDGITSAQEASWVYGSAQLDYAPCSNPGKPTLNIWLTNSVINNGAYSNLIGGCDISLSFGNPSVSPYDITHRIAGTVYGCGKADVPYTLPASNNIAVTDKTTLACSGPYATFTNTVPYTYVLDVSAGFAGNYQLTGSSGTGSLANWIAPCGGSCETSDSTTAGVNWPLIAAAIATTPTGAGCVGPNPVISTPLTLPTSAVGETYSVPLTATCGNPPYTWSKTSGAFPTGVSLTSGVIAGTPGSGTQGTYSPVLKVTDSSSNTASGNFTLTNNAGLAVPTQTFPSAGVGVHYSATAVGTGGIPPYTWTVTAGILPAGLMLATNGGITGIPAGPPGTSTFTLQACDLQLCATRPASIVVSGPVIVTSGLPGGIVGVAYTATLQAAGGTPPDTFQVLLGGDMKICPTLNTLGLCMNTSTSSNQTTIVGTPTGAGTSSFTVQVTDSMAAVGTRPFVLSVQSATNPVVVTSTSFPNGNVLLSYTPQTLTATGGTPPYTWLITGGALPPGLTLNNAGGSYFISGLPTTIGMYPFTIQATDSVSATGSANVSIEIDSMPTTFGNILLQGILVH